jgi:hypothetical protein
LAKKGETLPTAYSVFLDDPTTSSYFVSFDRKRIYFESKMAAYYTNKKAQRRNTRASRGRMILL